MVCFVPNLWHSSATTWLQNSLPWSEWSCLGGENRKTQWCRIISATVVASLSGMATKTASLVKASVMAKMYLLAVLDLRGPMRSTCTRSLGPSGTGRGSRGRLGMPCCFLRWHTGQCWINSRRSSRSRGHQYLTVILWKPLSTPSWPEALPACPSNRICRLRESGARITSRGYNPDSNLTQKRPKSSVVMCRLMMASLFLTKDGVSLGNVPDPRYCLRARMSSD